jgi:hypothetical protein
VQGAGRRCLGLLMALRGTVGGKMSQTAQGRSTRPHGGKWTRTRDAPGVWSRRPVSSVLVQLAAGTLTARLNVRATLSDELTFSAIDGFHFGLRLRVPILALLLVLHAVRAHRLVARASLNSQRALTQRSSDAPAFFAGRTRTPCSSVMKCREVSLTCLSGARTRQDSRGVGHPVSG